MYHVYTLYTLHTTKRDIIFFFKLKQVIKKAAAIRKYRLAKSIYDSYAVFSHEIELD